MRGINRRQRGDVASCIDIASTQSVSSANSARHRDRMGLPVRLRWRLGSTYDVGSNATSGIERCHRVKFGPTGAASWASLMTPPGFLVQVPIHLSHSSRSSLWGITKLGCKAGVGPITVSPMRTWWKRRVQTDAPELLGQNMFLSNRMDRSLGCPAKLLSMAPPG